jgi:hypothetical protein
MAEYRYSEDPAKEKAFLEFYAGVLEREAQAREGGSPDFAGSLRSWAKKARDNAAAMDTRPAQGELF